jgi:hypothetical protein
LSATGGDERAPARPSVLLDEGFVGSDACRACHARNHETWHASYHRTMTQPATPASVMAPFEGTTPVLEGIAWKLAREGEQYFATPVTPDGVARGKKMRVALTTGSHHYQIYWLEEDGAPEMAQLPLVWHLGERQWLPRKTMFLTPPGPSGLETGRWPRTCINCHATNGTQRHAADERTHVAEFGIACEACHGPGGAHVALQQRRKELPETSFPPDTTIVNPAELPHDRSAQVCGQCHGIHPLATPEARAKREKEGFEYRPGDDLARTRTLLRGTHDANSAELRAFLDRNPHTLDELFWKDGQVRVSGREYNGLVESACFVKGEMSCISCHALHPARDDARPLTTWNDDQLRAGMDGPGACLQCHDAYADPQKLAAHTHHAAGSRGQNCLDCHMPYTTYGLTKAIRSHTIASPSVASALASGRPNACNQCHLDRTLGWTADRLHEWYEHERPKLDADQETVAASILQALEGDAGQRALAAWNFGWPPARAASGTGWMPFVLSTLLQDSYDAVRFIALRTTRIDPRYKSLALDFTASIDAQRDAVRVSVLADWMRDGLRAASDRRDALLIRTDGKLDEERFRRIYARMDRRDVRLSE